MPPSLLKKILVPVDFSFCSREAFHVAVQLAKTFEARLILLHVIDTKALEALNNLGLPSPSGEKSQMKKLRHHARLQARTILQTPEAKNLHIDKVLAEGKPFVEIRRTVRSEKIVLIVTAVMGANGRCRENLFWPYG